MNVSNVLDADGRPLLLKVRALKSGAIDDIEFYQGAVMQVELPTALKLIKLGLFERKNPRKSGSRRRKAAVKKANLAVVSETVEYGSQTQVT
jgi:hypothetical protein